MDERTDYIQGEIRALKMLLSGTDYKCLKFAEGEMTAEEYADVRKERAEWREKINALEAELEQIEKEEQARIEAEIAAEKAKNEVIEAVEEAAPETVEEAAPEAAELEPSDAETEIEPEEQSEESAE